MKQGQVESKPNKKDRSVARLEKLYEEDETAWLEKSARLIHQGKLNKLDCKNLSEYLLDMSRRDKREVRSRLTTLMMYLLKWEHQPNKQTGSWKSTILEQQHELQDLLDSKTLKNHAAAILVETYDRAVNRAADETELPKSTFPAECPFTIDALLKTA